MSVETLKEASKNRFSFQRIGTGFKTDDTLIFEEITRELEGYLVRESNDLIRQTLF